MGLFRKAINRYRSDGLSAVIRDGWKYAIMDSRAAPYLSQLLGERLHHKLHLCVPLGYWPQINNPRTFNENITHRKLYTEDNRFHTVEDKWEVRQFVSEQIGDEYLPDVYQVTDSTENIRFESFPDSFVIKPTHLSGPVTIVRSDETPVEQQLTEQCRRWLSTTHGRTRSEYWYQEIEPRIIVEELLVGENQDIPKDYKFFVFHGDVAYIQIDFDRFSDHTRRIFDRDWVPQEFTIEYPLGPTIDEPKQLDEMIEVAEQLGAGFDFIRVDLYQLEDNRIVFGEMTVAPGSGEERITPRRFDFKLGSLW